MKKALRMGDLSEPRSPARRALTDIVEWKNLTVAGGYGHEPIDADEMMDMARKLRQALQADYVLRHDRCTSPMRSKAGKSVMFEAQLGALRDIDFGIYPYTSCVYDTRGLRAHRRRRSAASSSIESIGIMKAYSTCVGEGPFTCELFGDEAHALREAGGEYGAATGPSAPSRRLRRRRIALRRE